MRFFFCRRIGSKGFTLLEVVVVLILLGVLALVAVANSGKFLRTSGVSADSSSLKNHLRYVQIWSMSNTDRVYGIKCTGSSYSAFYVDAPSDFSSINISSTTDLALPGAETTSIPLANSSISAFNIVFDFTGRPYIGTGTSLSLRTTDYDLTLSGSGESDTLTITAYTGFIP